MIRRLIAALAAATVGCLAWLAVPQAAVPYLSAVGAYTYDAPMYDAPGNDSAQERGPPSGDSNYTTHDAVDLGPHGLSARPNGPSTPTVTTYATPVPPGQAVERATTTGRHVVLSDSEFSAVARTDVAAKADIGLSGRGLVPAAGTRIRPAGIPEGWRITGTKSQGGVLYRDPTNAGNSVRVMQGNPNSPFPNSQVPYVRWQRNGHPLDQYGNLLPSAKVPEAHIPLSDFRFMPEVFGP